MRLRKRSTLFSGGLSDRPLETVAESTENAGSDGPAGATPRIRRFGSLLERPSESETERAGR
ncbi:hypothetical protein [Natronoglomus mannanivorans]|uniref:Uncharacterized protein n=1 Tax=Natronoglomus mannanivorans TaxID=2979990 RepID=A0AAP3E3N7_9EURY|nr:hypothetical protein [Halobacteria archaeon AArc-xg1-1]